MQLFLCRVAGCLEARLRAAENQACFGIGNRQLCLCLRPVVATLLFVEECKQAQLQMVVLYLAIVDGKLCLKADAAPRRYHL